MSETSILARHLVPNVFDPAHYYQLDVRRGVMRNAFGAKCCTFSAYALQGLYTGLKNEAGPAWHLVMRSCGEAWGQRFARRFLEEIATFYQQGLEEMTMARFTALVEEAFATAGWGRLRVDLTQSQAGLVLVEVHNEVFGDLLRHSGERAGALMEGVLKAVFSVVTGKELECYETQSLGTGAATSRFVIGSRVRMHPVLTWIEAGAGHQEILDRLLETSPEAASPPTVQG